MTTAAKQPGEVDARGELGGRSDADGGAGEARRVAVGGPVVDDRDREAQRAQLRDQRLGVRARAADQHVRRRREVLDPGLVHGRVAAPAQVLRTSPVATTVAQASASSAASALPARRPAARAELGRGSGVHDGERRRRARRASARAGGARARRPRRCRAQPARRRIRIAPSQPAPMPNTRSSSPRSVVLDDRAPRRAASTASACSRRSCSRQPPLSRPVSRPSASISMRAPALR